MHNAARTLLALTATALLTGFLWLLLHNQSQTEYLTYYDFWRNYNVLAGYGSVDEYLFHDVHTYALASLIWSLDVWLAGGSLVLLHAIVLGLNLAIAGCLGLLTLRLLRTADVSRTSAAAVVATAMALWLSPSNSVGLTYPVMDIIASAMLLFVCLTAIVVGSAPGQTLTERGRHGRELGYLCVAALGFFSLEPFIAVPLFLAVDAALRRRHPEVLVHLVIAAVLLALYFALRERPVLQEAAPALHWEWLAFSYNLLVFLSMHVLMVLNSFGLSTGAATYIAIAASVIQLTSLAVFAVAHYDRESRDDTSPRFALALAAVGLLAVALAAWLRNSTSVMTEPVARYTPYSILFSMGVFFLSVRGSLTTKGPLARVVSWMAMLVILGYLAADAYAFWWRSYNPAETFAQSRLEMPVYATAPGSEVGLGPSEPDGGVAFRSRLHPFLKGRALAVFASPGYRWLGKPLPPVVTSDDARCALLGEEDAPGQRPQYTLVTVSVQGMRDNGVFLAADATGITQAFGFPAKRHPAQKTLRTLLPERDQNWAQLYYAEVRGGDLVSAVVCR